MADLIKTTVNAKELVDLQPVAIEKNVTEPKLTKVIIEEAIVLLKDLSHNGGYGDIAVAIGFEKITKAQVKTIHQAMNLKIAELNKPIDE